MVSGKSLSFIVLGISFIVFKFKVISSPSLPSPLDNPVTNLPFSYIKDAEIPSIFGSTLYSIWCSSLIFKKLFIFFQN